VDDKEQDDIKFYRQLVKDAATENERLQGICKSYATRLAEARELLVEWRGLRGAPVILASLTDTWLAAMAEPKEVPRG